MDIESSAATIFETFRLFLNQEVYGDELSIPVANKLVDANIAHLDYMLNNNQNDNWFDDVNTANQTENAIDVAIRALDATYNFLTDSLGSDIDKWEWGELHQVSFIHVMGNSAPFLEGLNLGPEPVNGSTYTINGYPDSIFISDTEPDFKSYRGSSFRLFAEVSIDWGNVRGLYAPGASGHLTSDNYDDGYDD